MNYSRRNRWRLALLVPSAVILAVMSCRDATTPDLGPPRMAVGDVLGPSNVPRSDRNDIPMPWSSTGLTMAAGIPYRVVVSGKLTFTLNPTWCSPGPPRTSIPPTVGPAGFQYDSRRPWKVVVGRGDSLNAPSSTLAFPPTSEAANEMSAFAQGPGFLWTQRPINPLVDSCSPDGHSSIPGWLVSGSQEIKAIELEPPKLVPNRPVAARNDTVLFTLQVSWTTNFFITQGLGWRWVSDTTVNTSQLIGPCNRFQLTCKVIVREKGHVELYSVYAEGMTFDPRSPVITVVPRRLRVTVTASPTDRVPAGMPARCGNLYAPMTVTVQASWTDGSSTSGLPVTLRTEYQATSGGHAHQATNRAGFGSFSPSSGAIGSNGQFQANYNPGSVSGSEKLFGRVESAEWTDSGSTIVSTKVFGLTEVFSGGNVLIGGSLPEHPRNTFANSLAIARITELADTFFAVTGKKIPYNDISLEWGGLFDLDRQFTIDGRHKEHRCGQDVDVVDTVGATIPDLEENLALLVRLLYPSGTYLRHGAGSYHLRLGRS